MSKFIKAHCNIGYCGAEYEEVLEFEDDATCEEIDQEVWNWATDHISYEWEEKSEEDEDE